MNKKVLVVLGISLALNFLFFGFGIARHMYSPKFHAIPAERMMLAPKGDFKGMHHADKSFAFPTMRRTITETFKDHSEEIQSARQSVKDAIKAENFDPEALKKALQSASAIRKNIDDIVQDKMAQSIASMTSQERQQFADKFDHPQKVERRPRQKRDPSPRRREKMESNNVDAQSIDDEEDKPAIAPCPMAKDGQPCPCPKTKKGKPCPMQTKDGQPCPCPMKKK